MKNPFDFSKLYLISATECESISKENAEKNSASQQQNDSEKEGGKRLKVSWSASRSKKGAKVTVADDRDGNNVPVLSNGCKLVGKLVEHFRSFGEEDKQSWPREVFLAMPGKDRFQLCHNDFPGVIF